MVFMKRLLLRSISIALFFIFLINLCACRNTDDGTKQDNPSTEQTTPGTKQPPQRTTFQTIQLNEQIATNDIEITFVDKLITSTANWTGDDDTKIFLEEHTDKMYFIARGTIKNLSTNEINIYSGLKAEFVLDGKYKYPVSIAPNSLNGIVPLETASFAVYCEMPKNVLYECEEYQLHLGFNAGFEAVEDVYSCQNGYQITGTVDEYGSAVTIQNFQTFTEFVEQDIEKRGYTNFTIEAQTNTATDNLLIDNGNFWQFQLPDGTDFNVSCELMLNYGIYDIYDKDNVPCGYGAIRIQVKESTSRKYLGAKELKVSSENGTLVINDQDAFGYYFDYNSSLKRASATFTFWSDRCSFVEFQNILNGENVILTVSIKEFDKDKPLITDIALSEKNKEALLAYLEFYKTLPLAESD